MLDMLRLVSSEDVGHDEASVQSLTKKHKVCLELLIQMVMMIIPGIVHTFLLSSLGGCMVFSVNFIFKKLRVLCQ